MILLLCLLIALLVLAVGLALWGVKTMDRDLDGY